MKTSIVVFAVAMLFTVSGVYAQSITPNDPRFGQQWNLRKIGATNAWATSTGNSHVVVAVIGGGINYRHEDLAANMWKNPGESGLDTQGNDKAANAIDDDGNGYVDDVHGIDTGDHDSDPMDKGGVPFHATACASVIGAVGNNSKGMSGVAWNVSLMALRVLPDDLTGTAADFLASQAEAIHYILMMQNRGVNVRVISFSGGYGSWASDAFRDAQENAAASDILWINAAANNGRDLDVWPQYGMSWRHRNMIVVGGTDLSDNLWTSSNYGRNTVDLAAPAVSILVASGPGNSAYAVQSGTSFAAPEVAGAAALLLGVNPSLRAEEVIAAIFGSVDQPPGLRGRVATNGRLNVDRALAYLANEDPPAIVVMALPRGQQTSPDAPIEVVFNRPMNRASVEAALEITPPIDGTFEWSTDSRSFVYRHDVPFDVTTNYTLRITGSAQDAKGGTLDGDYDRSRDGTPSDDLVWTFNYPVPNDDFTGAQRLTGTSGLVEATNQRATVEDAELPAFAPFPAHWAGWGSTLWYQWTPPEPGGWFTFDLTGGTSFDSLLSLFVGDKPDQLVARAFNDDYGTRTSGRISFDAKTGTSYSLVVASKFDGDPTEVGNFKLAWYPTPPPGFTGFQFSPSSGAPGTVVTLFGTNLTGATSLLFSGASATFTNAVNNNADLRISAVVPTDATSGPVTIVTPHGEITSTRTFQVLPPLLSIRGGNANELEITWPATDPALVLERSQTLTSNSWQPVSELTVKSNGLSKLRLMALPGQRFFRLRKN